MRYIGNKNKLLDELKSFIYAKAGSDFNTFCDIFSGTGTVGELFADTHTIIANDILHSAYILTHAKLCPPSKNAFSNLDIDPFELFNDPTHHLIGFITTHYAPQLSERMYFTHENSQRIDFIRTTIENWYQEQKITYDEYIYLQACLLESVSKVANVAGVYGSFLKSWDPRALKPLHFIKLPINSVSHKNSIYNQDISSLLETISGDVLYLDPPYTVNDYSVQYHLLETISKYDSPEIKGKTGGRTDTKKSKFASRASVQAAFEHVIAEAQFQHIFVSYSNKGLLSKEFIERCLKKYGLEKSYSLKEISYTNYTNHQSKRDTSLIEYIFYIQKAPKVYIESPLNYMGSKYNIIPEIINSIDTKPQTFLDVFGGGFNVGINVPANKVIYNDLNHFVRGIVELFYSESGDYLASKIEKTISKHGLEKANKETFVRFRSHYNSLPLAKKTHLDLYVLLQYGFQQQFRFNNKHEFNNTVGMSSYNTNTLVKLLGFSREIKKKNVEFYSTDFEQLLTKKYDEPLYYFDPPYLVTLGSYNDGKRGFKGWGVEDERRLYNSINEIHKRGDKFILSNVLVHKEKKNEILSQWLESGKYSVKTLCYKNRTEIIVKNF